MLIDIQRTFVRPPNSDIIEDGEWYWQATWQNPLRPDSYDDHDYVSVLAACPWDALGKLVVKLEELF